MDISNTVGIYQGSLCGHIHETRTRKTTEITVMQRFEQSVLEQQTTRNLQKTKARLSRVSRNCRDPKKSCGCKISSTQEAATVDSEIRDLQTALHPCTPRRESHGLTMQQSHTKRNLALTMQSVPYLYVCVVLSL